MNDHLLFTLTLDVSVGLLKSFLGTTVKRLRGVSAQSSFSVLVGVVSLLEKKKTAIVKVTQNIVPIKFLNILWDF